MQTTLDSTVEFELVGLKAQSWEREAVEQSVAGLDGVLSIDLGMRGREIGVKGVLRAVSDDSLEEKETAISALMDGGTHILATRDGRVFDNLRIDAFEVNQKDYSGRGVCCEFEIKFMQLSNL